MRQFGETFCIYLYKLNIKEEIMKSFFKNFPFKPYIIKVKKGNILNTVEHTLKILEKCKNGDLIFSRKLLQLMWNYPYKEI